MDAATGELVRERAGNLCEYCHLPQVFSGLRFPILNVTVFVRRSTEPHSSRI